VDDAVVAKKLVEVPAVRERVPKVERPFTVRVPSDAVLAFKVVEVAVPKKPSPEAVRLVVDAPPFMENKPDVIVELASDKKPFENVASPFCVSVPLLVREPRDADDAKRFVEEATVENKLEEVAFPSVTFPVEVKLAAVRVVPSNESEPFFSVK